MSNANPLDSDCNCGKEVGSTSAAPIASEAPVDTLPDSSGGRAIYIVFARKLQGSPIRILFLLEDQDHGEGSPLVVEALRNNRFQQVISEDGTRALGESGIITLSLDTPPTETELFGISGYWIRLRPRASKASLDWRPRIRGAYANAMWAEAAETQEMEILGSSDGSPSQRLSLGRPPVLEDSLELRVREPLGDEEMQELAKTASGVVENPPGLPGRWARWAEVVDPGDAGPGERVYALDFASGEIRFGDGVHGAIPPMGRDAVVAFRYRHGGSATANAVPRFSPLNLVTPIDGVEAAIAPEAAAGGADPEDIATVRRFASAKLRHRDRAVTLKDLEDLALNYSPEIAQARSLRTAQGVRLLLVIRGPDPQPSQALSRELSRYLSERAGPALNRNGALKIAGAQLFTFHVQLSLRVTSLDVTGRISQAAKTAVQKLFDTATGGSEGLGWSLGVSPKADDVAAALIAIAGPEGISHIRFSRVDGTAIDAPDLTIEAHQLAWLAPDGTSVQFTAGAVPS